MVAMKDTKDLIAKLSVLRSISSEDDLYLQDENIHKNQLNLIPNLEVEELKEKKSKNDLIQAIFEKKQSLIKKAFSEAKNIKDLIASYQSEIDSANITNNKRKKPLVLDFSKEESRISELKNQVYQIEIAASLFEKVKKNANYKCQFCGFQDEFFLEIHHLDGNHLNHSEENLIPSCSLCHRQHHLFWLATTTNASLGGTKTDVLDQAVLNHLQRICFVMSDEETEEKYQKKLGINGKLGTKLLTSLESNFKYVSQHVFLTSDDFQEKVHGENGILSKIEVTHPETEISVSYKVLKGVLDQIDEPEFYNLNQAKKNEIYLELDNYFNSDEQASQKGIPKEQFRSTEIMRLRIQLENIKSEAEDQANNQYQDETSVFSILELALSLAKMKYETFQCLQRIPYLFVIYKPSIFTPTQIKYYRNLSYFDPKNWFLTNSMSSSLNTLEDNK